MSKIQDYTTADIDIYSEGIVSCSVCVPEDMEKHNVELLVNFKSPTKISSDWTISDEETFSDGITPHPTKCQDHKRRIHYLLHC